MSQKQVPDAPGGERAQDERAITCATPMCGYAVTTVSEFCAICNLQHAAAASPRPAEPEPPKVDEARMLELAKERAELADRVFVHVPHPMDEPPKAEPREVFTERGRCQWHDTEHVELVPSRSPRLFYCALCASEHRVTKNARPASPPKAEQEPCRVPPAGWYCTRGAGHAGPCAARPTGGNEQAWDDLAADGGLPESQPKADAGTLEAVVEARIEQAAADAELYGHLYARDALRDALTELRRRQEELSEARAGEAFYEEQQERRNRQVGTCAECKQPIKADGSRTVENREDSPEWHSWCYARVQKARADALEARASSPDLRALADRWRVAAGECGHEGKAALVLCADELDAAAGEPK